MSRIPNNTIEVSEERRISASLRVWLSVIAAVSLASIAYAALASGTKTIDDHELRLRTLEKALSKLEGMDAKIDWMQTMMMEADKRQRSNSLRVGP